MPSVGWEDSVCHVFFVFLDHLQRIYLHFWRVDAIMQGVIMAEDGADKTMQSITNL